MNVTDPIFHLVYTSYRAEGITDDDVVDEIVLPAMARNRRLDVTGCIWFNRVHFLQVLEGNESAVRAIFDDIRVDPRHHTIDLLTAEIIPMRNFERFNMRAITSDAPASVQDLIERAVLRKAEPTRVIEGLEQLVRRVISDLAVVPNAPPGGASLA